AVTTTEKSRATTTTRTNNTVIAAASAATTIVQRRKACSRPRNQHNCQSAQPRPLAWQRFRNSQNEIAAQNDTNLGIGTLEHFPQEWESAFTLAYRLIVCPGNQHMSLRREPFSVSLHKPPLRSADPCNFACGKRYRPLFWRWARGSPSF